ncbi:MAG: macro domain-containing protein [Bacteroidota bacterium]
MIERVQGDLLQAPAEALVNTVNSVGVMGKGIALQFKKAYPENFAAYKVACDEGAVQPGRMFVFDRGGLIGEAQGPRYIINFPTKQHWRGKSQMRFIDEGLRALIDEVRERGITSVAIPPLGSGNGGLKWSEVRPRIEAAFAELPNVHLLLYEPGGTPDARRSVVRTKRPKMTKARALYLVLFDMYQVLDYELTNIEAQKLAYFMQETGEPLKLRYQKGHYGPYADNLNHTLQALDGHYLQGVGDRDKARAAMTPYPDAIEEAHAFLDGLPDASTTHTRLALVQRLIEGYETPYGLELLATVHWLMRQDEDMAASVEKVVESVQAWSPRKQHLMEPHHIEVAWHHLHENGWTPTPRLV